MVKTQDGEGLATLRDLLNMYICIYRSVITLYDTEVQRKHFAQRPTLNEVSFCCAGGPPALITPGSYLPRWPSVLARFSSVSAASLMACSTIMFLFLVSSILMGFDSGRFCQAVQRESRNISENNMLL